MTQSEFHQSIIECIRRGYWIAYLDASCAVRLVTPEPAQCGQLATWISAEEYRQLWLARRLDGYEERESNF